VSHALELEKHADRHKTEVKRNQAVFDVKVQDELLRMKHTHEQEINKLLRENERLQKIIARYGGGHLSARVLSDEDTARSGTGMFGPGRTVSSTMADINRAPSPLQTPMPLSSLSTASPANSKLNWGALNESLAAQEEINSNNAFNGGRSGYSSPSRSVRSLRSSGTNHFSQSPRSPHTQRVISALTGEDPPSTFTLDEALATRGKPGIRVADTTKRVETYLGQLQDYLEVSDPFE
jgi:hypothetical protein